MLWFVLAACVKGSPVVSTPAPPPQLEAVNPAGLFVLVVVDQLPVRLLETPKERYTAGLARLTGPQASVGVARYAHAITYTCPGHATISTGRSPSAHGIISNDWRDRAHPEQSTYCADPAFLRVPTLADQVVGAGGSVASLSLKDRAAMMMGGEHATLTSWYDKSAASFTGALAGRVDIESRLVPWEALYPEDYAGWVGDDADPIEQDVGFGTTFPHPAANAKNFLYAPFSAEALVDAALLATDDLQLGTDDTPDLLAVSFSQTDYIGHAFTAESWEAMDNMIRLDRAIGRLLEGLESRVGEAGLTVVLTSDHGSFTAQGKHRIPSTAVEDAANTALASMGLEGKAQFESPSLYLPPEISADRRDEVAKGVAKAVGEIEGIETAWAWRTDAPPPTRAASILASVDDERSGDVYVMRGASALYDYRDEAGVGTSHGTPFAEDTDVPFLAWGRGVTPGKRGTVDVRAVAPTIAASMGLEPIEGWLPSVW